MAERSFQWSSRRRNHQQYRPRWPPRTINRQNGMYWNPRDPYSRFAETGSRVVQEPSVVRAYNAISSEDVSEVETPVTRDVFRDLEKTTSTFTMAPSTTTSPPTSTASTTTTTFTATQLIAESPIEDIEKLTTTYNVDMRNALAETDEPLFTGSGHINKTIIYGNTSVCSSTIIEASHAAYLYGIIFLIVVSLLLNSLSIIIFQSKGLRKFPFSVYLVALAVTDTLSLCSYIPRKWLTVLYMALGYSEQKTFYDTNKIACKAFTYLTYVLRFLSSWLLVAIGTDRLLVASTPYKRSRYPKLKSARHGFCYCIVAAILFNAHVLFVWDSTVVAGDDSASCVPMSMSPILALGLTILTVVLIVGLPFVIIGGLAVMIIRNLPAWNLRPRRLSSTVIGRALFEKDATVMVVSILVAYCVLCVPYIITWVVLLWQHFMAEFPLCRYIDGAAARDIAEVGFMVNFAIKFLLCVFFGGDVLSMK